MTHAELADFYLGQGLTRDQFWIGPEHPALESLALEFLASRDSKSVLEIGYQAGGFAVPVIRALGGSPGFRYTGVDNLSYGNAVNSRLIAEFLARQGVPLGSLRFLTGDAFDFLMRCDSAFDLILLDHVKRLYPRELQCILTRGILAKDGVLLVHDVLAKASAVSGKCERICTRLGYSWEVRDDVPSGVAVVRANEPRLARGMAGGAYRIALELRYSARRVLRRAARRQAR